MSYLLTARWKYSETIAAEPFKLMVLLFFTAVAAMAAKELASEAVMCNGEDHRLATAQRHG